MELRGVFEGVGWVEILNAFNARLRVVVSLVVVVPTNEHRKWSANMNSAPNGIRATDLTGIFCTSGSEREFTLEGSWYADQEIQAGANRDAAAAG